MESAVSAESSGKLLLLLSGYSRSLLLLCSNDKTYPVSAEDECSIVIVITEEEPKWQHALHVV